MPRYIDADKLWDCFRNRQSALTKLCGGYRFLSDPEDKKEYDYIDTVLSEIDSAPTEDVAPVVHGKWENFSEPDEDGNVECHCSVCFAGDKHAVDMNVSFCWKCGARMDGDT